MTKRYRERLEDVEVAVGQVAVAAPPAAPVTFRWRGARYRVTSVLGHWYEDEGWWRRTDGMPQRIVRTDLWRVEAGPCTARDGAGDVRTDGTRDGAAARDGAGGGVYELVQRGDEWRLDRIWD